MKWNRLRIPDCRRGVQEERRPAVTHARDSSPSANRPALIEWSRNSLLGARMLLGNTARSHRPGALMNRRRLLAMTLFLLVAPRAYADDSTPLYRDASAPIDARVEDLLGRMTLDEKIGQMTQAERSTRQAGRRAQRRGSARCSPAAAGPPSPNTPRPGPTCTTASSAPRWQRRWAFPMIYGIDAVHGHNNVYGATIFPHNIGLGATRDPALVQQHRPGHRRGGRRHRHRLGLRALPVRGAQRPLGPHLRVLRRGARSWSRR